MRAAKAWVRIALGAGLALAGAPALAQGARCTHEDLVGIADAYLAAQAAGEAGKLPLADFTQYSENGEDASLFSGLLGTARKIDWHRTLYDDAGCTAFVEAVIADPTHPYVVGTRLQFSGRDNPIAPSRVNQIESVVTDAGDWLFNAKKTLAFAKAEDWAPIPAGERDSRATLLAAANAYLDRFNDPKVSVPFGSPCALLEGGVYSGKGGGAPADRIDRCDFDLPTGVKIGDRRPIVDESLGAVAILSSFGPNALADVHVFRIEKGKIRFIHSLTQCKAADCGLKVPDEVKKRLGD